jgi:hypothetical protein
MVLDTPARARGSILSRPRKFKGNATAYQGYTGKLMRSDPFVAPLRLVLRRSGTCLKAIAVLHALLAFSVLVTYPISGASVGIITGIALSAYWTHRELCAAPRAFYALLYDSDGHWWATDHTGGRFHAVMIGTPLRTSWLVVLPLAIDRRRYTVALAADVTPPDPLRRLRVRLRYASSMPTITSAAE